jgi:hypothetical protein
VRLIPRLLLVAAVAAGPAGFVVASCSTDAVGVDACRTIEEARCQMGPLCTQGFDVARCTRFYRDQCLVGIQNTTDTSNDDLNAAAKACVSALQVAAACVADGGAAGPCPGLALIPDASCTEVTPSDPTACNVITACPEVLQACNFVAAPPDGGVDAAAEAAADAASD